MYDTDYNLKQFTHLKLKDVDPAKHTSVTLKLSGDGAANAIVVFLTFLFPGLASDVLSAAGI